MKDVCYDLKPFKSSKNSKDLKITFGLLSCAIGLGYLLKWKKGEFVWHYVLLPQWDLLKLWRTASTQHAEEAWTSTTHWSWSRSRRHDDRRTDRQTDRDRWKTLHYTCDTSLAYRSLSLGYRVAPWNSPFPWCNPHNWYPLRYLLLSPTINY